MAYLHFNTHAATGYDDNSRVAYALEQINSTKNTYEADKHGSSSWQYRERLKDLLLSCKNYISFCEANPRFKGCERLNDVKESCEKRQKEFDRIIKENQNAMKAYTNKVAANKAAANKADANKAAANKAAGNAAMKATYGNANDDPWGEKAPEGGRRRRGTTRKGRKSLKTRKSRSTRMRKSRRV